MHGVKDHLLIYQMSKNFNPIILTITLTTTLTILIITITIIFIEIHLFWSWASLSLRSLSASSSKVSTFPELMTMMMMMSWMLVIMMRRIISQTFCPCGELSVSLPVLEGNSETIWCCWWLLLVKELVWRATNSIVAKRRARKIPTLSCIVWQQFIVWLALFGNNSSFNLLCLATTHLGHRARKIPPFTSIVWQQLILVTNHIQVMGVGGNRGNVTKCLARNIWTCILQHQFCPLTIHESQITRPTQWI